VRWRGWVEHHADAKREARISTCPRLSGAECGRSDSASVGFGRRRAGGVVAGRCAKRGLQPPGRGCFPRRLRRAQPQTGPQRQRRLPSVIGFFVRRARLLRRGPRHLAGCGQSGIAGLPSLAITIRGEPASVNRLGRRRLADGAAAAARAGDGARLRRFGAAVRRVGCGAGVVAVELPGSARERGLFPGQSQRPGLSPVAQRSGSYGGARPRRRAKAGGARPVDEAEQGSAGKLAGGAERILRSRRHAHGRFCRDRRVCRAVAASAPGPGDCRRRCAASAAAPRAGFASV
jgi:hypothetical protein